MEGDRTRAEAGSSQIIEVPVTVPLGIGLPDISVNDEVGDLNSFAPGDLRVQPLRFSVPLPEVDLASGGDEHGETLRRLLQRMVTIRRTPERPTELQYNSSNSGPQQVSRTGARGDDDEVRLGVLTSVLESQTLAAVLDDAIDIENGPGDVAIFSIIGYGAFELDVIPSLQTVTVSELTTGSSVGFYNDALEGGDSVERPHRKFNLIQFALGLVVDFVSSAPGFLVTIIAILCALCWLAIKLAAVIRSALARV